MGEIPWLRIEEQTPGFTRERRETEYGYMIMCIPDDLAEDVTPDGAVEVTISVDEHGQFQWEF